MAGKWGGGSKSGGSMKNKAVRIPFELYKKIEERVKVTEFESVEEYVTFALEEVVKEGEEPQEYTLSDEDEEKVKERLRGLGYL
jgi:Arc/MetJ-type ribon-helix-helix transcriptional regulator